ncbi:hypothetical protein [Rhizobium sp. LC145]|uniref:hypothetical protein n=1 Tax=Rhizobium sp. LC145 TaxID=1120688 RepID=UPI000629E979|nr:hypothetical protein [Rhizobium sp. LC145]KKX33987.1 hypothetical protein YH62_02105 [Rhizobium sp. LC145]TKT67047.1 hypothetical protein FDR95_05050 [Rhizobiaceae bacterium LC148]
MSKLNHNRSALRSIDLRKGNDRWSHAEHATSSSTSAQAKRRHEVRISFIRAYTYASLKELEKPEIPSLLKSRIMKSHGDTVDEKIQSWLKLQQEYKRIANQAAARLS